MPSARAVVKGVVDRPNRVGDLGQPSGEQVPLDLGIVVEHRRQLRVPVEGTRVEVTGDGLEIERSQGLLDERDPARGHGVDSARPAEYPPEQRVLIGAVGAVD